MDMFQQEQRMQREYNCKKAYYPNPRCLGSIQIIQVIFPSGWTVLPWYAVIRIDSCENNV